MKKYFTTIVLTIILSINSSAQDPNLIQLALNTEEPGAKSGVYKTFTDYENNKLSYKTDCKSEKHRIKLNEFLNEPYITVKRKDEKVRLRKDSIYGVLVCDEPLIRFQNGEHFYLAEKGSIWIFYKDVPLVQIKGTKYERKYFFSLKGDGNLIDLTVNNIKQAFPDNHTLHDMMDAQFQGADISEYDTFHKMFKVNRLIIGSNNSNCCTNHSDVRGREGDKCSKCGINLEKTKKSK